MFPCFKQGKMSQRLSQMEQNIVFIINKFKDYTDFNPVTPAMTKKHYKIALEKELPNILKVGLLPEFGG